MCKILISGLLLTLAGAAQTPRRAPAPVRKPMPPAPKSDVTPPETRKDFLIEKISVDGLQRYKPAQVIKVSGLKVGDVGSKEIFDKAQARLVEAGVFANTGYRYEPGQSGKGFALTFEVKELDQVYPIRFEGLQRPDSELRDALAETDPLFGQLIPATQPVLKRYVKALKDYMNTTDVTAKVVTDNADKLTVVFRSSQAALAIAEVDFTGSKEFRPEDLRNKVASLMVGVAYSETRVREILDAQLRPYYESKGLVRVKWTKISSEPVKDVTGFRVNVTVDEGPAYGLQAVEVAGVNLVKELVAETKLKTGDVFNYDAVEQGKDKISKYLQRRGYIRVKVTNERAYNDEKKLVTVKYLVTPGSQFTFRSLKIEGLDLLSEPPIRKMWSLKEGKLFNAEYPTKFLNDIREQQLFDHLGEETKAKLNIDDKANAVDVTLEFKGDQPKKKSLILGAPPPED